MSLKFYHSYCLYSFIRENEDENILVKQAENKEKCKYIMKDKYGKQDYIEKENIYTTRQMFRTRVGLQPFAANFKHDKKFARTNWLCRCLQSTESETHLKFENCPQYADIRVKFDTLEDDQSLAKFFREVLARRDALDEGASGGLPATDVQLADGDPGHLGDLEASQSGGPVPN